MFRSYTDKVVFFLVQRDFSVKGFPYLNIAARVEIIFLAPIHPHIPI